MLKWNYTLFTCSVSWVPSQQNTNTLENSAQQYNARACDTSVKSPQLYKSDNIDIIKLVWTCLIILKSDKEMRRIFMVYSEKSEWNNLGK